MSQSKWVFLEDGIINLERLDYIYVDSNKVYFVFDNNEMVSTLHTNEDAQIEFNQMIEKIQDR
jgi:hypothetical protein